MQRFFFIICISNLFWLQNIPAQNWRILKPEKIPVNKFIDKTERYSQYDGKTIKTINIVVLEPFGATVSDTVVEKNSLIVRFFNLLHIRTKKFVVRDLLLFSEGSPFDALSVRESERLIRQSAFVKDSRIIINETEFGELELTVIVSDVFSISADLISFNNPTGLHVYDYNFFGYAHKVETDLYYNFQEKDGITFNGAYTIPYIHNTYTSITGFFNYSPKRLRKGIAIERNFFSPLTDWAGGTAIVNESGSELGVPNGNSQAVQLRSTEQDYWIGRSFSLGENTALERSRKIAVAARVNNIKLMLKSPILVDTLNLQLNQTLLLASVGYSQRQYYINSDIYRFGITEDIPVGMAVDLTGGYEFTEKLSRPYFRTRLAYGNHLTGLGNFSAGIDYGTFIRNGKSEQGAITYSFSGFTDLLKIGNWGIRQFVYSLGYYGINRLENEKVSLNADNEIYGYYSNEIFGTKKIALNFQTVFYSPLSILGFRFAPVILIGFGMIGDENNNLFRGNVYQTYGAGILIRNESLLFRTFQLSFAFHPPLPGQTASDYRINPIGTYDLRYHDFFLQKPGLVPYR